MSEVDLVERLISFVNSAQVEWNGQRRSWSAHASGRGYVDEDGLVQPVVFPQFAQAFLDFELGVDLGAERSGATAGATKPDFTPADLVTHRFCFECKGSSDALRLDDHRSQLFRYLQRGVVSHVVLTNMVQIKVFELDEHENVVENTAFSVNLRGLWNLSQPDLALGLEEAKRFVRFVEQFSRVELTVDQMVDRIRSAKPWDDLFAVSDSEWLRNRIDDVVRLLQEDVGALIDAGLLDDRATLTADDRSAVVDEIRRLGERAGMLPDAANQTDLAGFVAARAGTPAREALDQYAASVAYWYATRLVLVRIWEDLNLLQPATLYDGGFDSLMTAFGDRVDQVIGAAFSAASQRYRALFDQHTTYSWYRPHRNVAVRSLYHLATTFLGAVDSDVLGQVYERMLARTARKNRGQYYTPRDVISMMWDFATTDELVAYAESEDRTPLVVDIATGSGGFLVEGVARLRSRMEGQVRAGASMTRQEWLNRVSESFIGIEVQRFPAFLAEINLLIQFSKVLAEEPELRVPEISIIPADTLSLHNAWSGGDAGAGELVDEQWHIDAADRLADVGHVADPFQNGRGGFDLAIGNPPYIGEKTASAADQRPGAPDTRTGRSRT